MTEPRDTFTWKRSVHFIGDPKCPSCWQQAPDRCENDDGGLVHQEFEDEDMAGNYWLAYQCDAEL